MNTRAQIVQDDLTRVGPGSTMGELMRQYWIPACLSRELAVDGDPVRLKLLGEQLIAFRPEDRFCDKVRAGAYPAAEHGSLVWAYMGGRSTPPPLPRIEVTLLPESELEIQPVMRRCNWLQAMEGDIDTPHFGFLHIGHLEADELDPDNPMIGTVTNRAPSYQVRDTPWGTSYGAYRNGGEGSTYWRFANFMFPFWTQQPQGPFERHVHARAWVPLDDEHTMFINVMWSELTDREAPQSGRIYTGTTDIHLQDQTVTESMGPITDFTNEHLTTSDMMIFPTRRRALLAARAWRDDGEVPPGVDDPDAFYDSRSGFFLAPDDVDWLAAYQASLASAERPAERAVERPSGSPV